MCSKITYGLTEKFRQYLINEEKSIATQEKYLRDVRYFFEWTSGHEISKQTVLEYKEHLTESMAPASVNSVLSSLNSFFDFCSRQDLKVKMLKIQRQIFMQKEKELTKAEYVRLLEAAKSNKRLYLLMQTICSSGIRVSELKYVTAEAVRERKAIIRCKGKMRVILLPADLCRLLKDYTESKGIKSGPVFITRTGKPIDRSTIWKMMKSLCERARVPRKKVFPHNLRHLFARTFYSIRKDIVRLADVLGHSSVNTTRIYTMETGENHRRQIQRLGLLQT